MTTINIEMSNHSCAHCGAIFSVADAFMQSAKLNYLPVHCPNGHENFYMSDKEVTELREAKSRVVSIKADLQQARAEITELKGQMVDLRHRAEVAEARAVREPATARGSEPPTPPAGTLDEIPDDTVVIHQNGNGRYVCPRCDITLAVSIRGRS